MLCQQNLSSSLVDTINVCNGVKWNTKNTKLKHFVEHIQLTDLSR